MRPAIWQPPVALSPAEQTIVRRVKRAKLFVFLRTQRHLIFDESYQEELATLYAEVPKGQPPIAPRSAGTGYHPAGVYGCFG